LKPCPTRTWRRRDEERENPAGLSCCDAVQQRALLSLYKPDHLFLPLAFQTELSASDARRRVRVRRDDTKPCPSTFSQLTAK